jgi:Polyketide cyclase / dehydrase and lipid transport
MDELLLATDDRSSASTVLDHPVDRVWQVVRDFNSYPVWVNGVDESHIEDGLPGTAAGCIRNFSLGGSRTRQELRAHSDLDRYFTYASCAPFTIDDDGTARTLHRYEGTLQLYPITDGDRTFAVWSASYQRPATDAAYWGQWWAQSLPTWLGSLRNYLGRR